MGVKASKDQIDAVIPDVFYKSAEGLSFDEVASSSMGSSLGVAHINDWLIVVNPNNALTFNTALPTILSSTFELLTFFIADDDPIFRHYANGTVVQATEGLEALDALLEEKGITPQDQYGESKMLQLVEHELLYGLEGDWISHLFDAGFELYELD